jgi:hypothetical protein
MAFNIAMSRDTNSNNVNIFIKQMTSSKTNFKPSLMFSSESCLV